MRLSNLRAWQILLCLIVLLGGLAVGWEGRRLLGEEIQREGQAQFDERAGETVRRIGGRLDGVEESVRALGDFMRAQPLASHSAFKAYAAPAARRNPAIRALDWIPLVPHKKRAAFERARRKSGLPDYAIRERDADDKLIVAAQRLSYLPIAMTEPLFRNSVSLGFDIASNPRRREAAERARDTAAPAATERLRLEQDSDIPTVRLLVPVYWGGEAPENAEERRHRVWGYAGATLDLAALIGAEDNAQPGAGGRIGAIQLIDLTSDARPLVHGIGDVRSGQADVLQKPFRETLSFGGRQWEIILYADPAAAPRGSWLPDAVMAVSAVLALLLAGFLASLFGSQRMAVILADRRGKELDKERHESENILATMLDPLIVIDPRGRIKRFNPAAEKLFGYAAEEVLEQNIKLLMPEPYHSAHDGYLRRYMAGGEARIIGKGREIMAQRKDGSQFPAELSVTESGIGNARRFVGVIRDLTERKAAEAQLNLLKRALEAADNGVVITDPTSRIVWVNPAFTRTTGYGAEEAIGQNPSLLKSGRQGQAFYARMWETILAGEVWHGELDNRRKDGTLYPEEMTITPIRDGAGAITHYVAIKQDITERKRLERMKSEFVSTVSHELRTPLTSIRGSLGLIVGGAVGELPEKARGLAQIACNNSDRLVRLINDILDIEKIESGRMNFSLRPVLLDQVAQEAVHANEGFGREHGVAIALDNALPGAKVLADPDRLNQVITNLISNAAKFSPAGETVRVSIAAHGDGVRLSVADRGPGIPEEFRDRIFEKFSQADATDARKVGGTGLGLSITKVIVERFGGELTFDSERGVGTVFHVDLPLWSDAPILAHREDNDDDGHAVLVCEDDANAARVLAALLESRGMRADVALSAEEAWQKLAENDYAAMTLDIGLPGQDGLSLLRQMRGEARTAHLPVLIVSGSKPDDAEKAIASLDVEDWLLKPIDEARLVQAVRRIAGKNSAGLPRVLHVEDDPDICRVVAGMLEGSARPVPAATLAAAREALAVGGAFDLILLDIGLPDGSGLDLLPEAAERNIPVVIFSAHEPDPDTASSVAAVLVKSRTDSARLAATIEKIVKRHLQ